MADHDAGAIGGGGGGVNYAAAAHSGGGGGVDGGNMDGGGVSNSSNPQIVLVEKNSILNKLFSSCSPDPRGSVHRAWGISLLFVVMYFALSIFESKFFECINKNNYYYRG